MKGAFHIEHEGNNEQKREDSWYPVRAIGVVLEITGALRMQKEKGTNKQKGQDITFDKANAHSSDVLDVELTEYI